jgi:uroporphyrinogen decarboxylase
LLERLAGLGAAVVGVDWRIPLDEAWRRMGFAVAIQGNLDPAALLAPRELLALRARQVLEQAAGRAGHIFNLGHGIPPEAEPDQVRFLVDFVHEQTAQGREHLAGARPRQEPSTLNHGKGNGA